MTAGLSLPNRNPGQRSSTEFSEDIRGHVPLLSIVVYCLEIMVRLFTIDCVGLLFIVCYLVIRL